MTRATVDNSGDGNCMYYAYGISLMYFLKNKDKSTAEKIFSKLELSDSEKQRLHELLDDKKLTQFTRRQITNIIEPILGYAARRVAAEQTRIVFLNTPQESTLFTAVNLRAIDLFHKLLKSKKSDLADLLQNNDYYNPNITDSEAYRFLNESPKTTVALQDYLSKSLDNILCALDEQWDNRVDQFVQYTQQAAIARAEEDKLIDPSYDAQALTDMLKAEKMRISSSSFHKTLFLEELITQKVIQFFTEENAKHLNDYVNYLNTDFKWASEETLLLLHRHVQGEHTIVLPNGKKDFTWDTPISLAIYSNGRRAADGKETKPDMILNNRNNRHWLSFVEIDESMVSTLKLAPAMIEKKLIIETTEEVKPVIKNVVVTPVSDNPEVKPVEDPERAPVADKPKVKSAAEPEKAPVAVKPKVKSAAEPEKAPVAVKPKVKSTEEPEKAPVAVKPKVKSTEEPEKAPVAVKPKVKPVSDNTTVKPISKNQVVKPIIDETPPAVNSIIQRRLRDGYLISSGFSTYLTQLETKAKELSQKHPEASKEAADIHKQLFELKQKFIKYNNPTPSEFSRKCADVVTNSPKSHLAQHRGIGGVLNALLNALISMLNKFIQLSTRDDHSVKFFKNDPIKTESIDNINKLEGSITALKQITKLKNDPEAAKDKHTERLDETNSIALNRV